MKLIFWKKLIQRELTCEKPVAYTKKSTYLKNQIPIGTLMATINWSCTTPQSMAVLMGIPDEYFCSKWQNQIRLLNFPAAYYVNTMKEFGVCPKLLQTDCGIENILMVIIQSILQGSVDAHCYYPPVANIRIENCWSHKRKGYIGSLINFFKDMKATDEFNLGNTLRMELAWYNFSPLLQHELDQVKLKWNTHYIRRTRHDTMHGRLDTLFSLPQLSGG